MWILKREEEIDESMDINVVPQKRTTDNINFVEIFIILILGGISMWIA